MTLFNIILPIALEGFTVKQWNKELYTEYSITNITMDLNWFSQGRFQNQGEEGTHLRSHIARFLLYNLLKVRNGVKHFNKLFYYLNYFYYKI